MPYTQARPRARSRRSENSRLFEMVKRKEKVSMSARARPGSEETGGHHYRSGSCSRRNPRHYRQRRQRGALTIVRSRGVKLLAMRRWLKLPTAIMISPCCPAELKALKVLRQPAAGRNRKTVSHRPGALSQPFVPQLLQCSCAARYLPIGNMTGFRR